MIQEPSAPQVSIEEEVLSNVKGQQIGPATVADLALPDDFLRRVGDRVIRTSYEERFRIVVPDPTPDATKATTSEPAKPTTQKSAADGSISIGLIIGTIVLLGFVVWIVFGRKSEEKYR
jgi:hypothetical protein